MVNYVVVREVVSTASKARSKLFVLLLCIFPGFLEDMTFQKWNLPCFLLDTKKQRMYQMSEMQGPNGVFPE